MRGVTIYHGSVNTIEKPVFGKGNIRNDYGLGFYCTENIELAKEWACNSLAGGFVNIYEIDTSEFDILYLNAPEYGILNWLAVLVNNRVFSADAPIIAEGIEYLTEFFYININQYDVIKGYRADDSYFSFATDFLSNTISLRQLKKAMHLGSLGEQFVIKSKKAFNTLRFIHAEPVDGSIYYIKRYDRDKQARDQYFNRERMSPRLRDDIFMLDILREEMKRGDARLQ